MFKKKDKDKVENGLHFVIDLKSSEKAVNFPESENKSKIDFRYPLIVPYAYAHITWDEVQNSLIYKVEEPVLDSKEKEILLKLEQGIKEFINMSFISVKQKETLIEFLEKNVQILLNEMNIKLERNSYLKLMYYIYRDFIGLNRIEPLMNDGYIEDIECNGRNSSLYIVHRRYGNIKTNITFDDFDELSDFVEKLAQKSGRYISYSSPIVDGVLPDGSRVNATFTEDVSSKGPTFTIRKFTREAWSPVKLMEIGSVSPEILAYLWLLVENGSNILVVGGTGSGKTSLINVIAFFIPPEARIVSIEDSRELRLEHENWLPSVARIGVGAGKDKTGAVTMFDLLKESFRQRPDYVIVGEVRGEEASVLFQGMASVREDEKIMVLNSENPKNIAISDLKDDIKYKSMSIDPEDGKVKIMPVQGKIRHDPRIKLLKIQTKSGREVTITEDHSLFTYDQKIIPIRGEDLNEGDIIVIPGKLPDSYADLDYINLIKFLPEIRVFAPKYVRKAVGNLGYVKSCDVICQKAISDYYANFTKNNPSSLESEKFLKLMSEAGINYDINQISVKFLRKSKSYPAKFKITKEFLKLLGYYLSDGTINDSGRNSSIRLYNKNKKILEDMRNCIASVAGSKIRERITDRGFGSATELSFSHKVLFEFIKKYCGKGSKNKKIPDFIYGLNKEKIGFFLSGLYNGDGWISRDLVGYSTISRQLADGLTKLLLVFGIVGRIKSSKGKNRKNIDYRIIFYTTNELTEFLKYVTLIRKKVILRDNPRPNPYKIEDIYLDKIKNIQKIRLKNSEYVYDISVPGCQNFIGGFGGILLHNSGHASMATMHADDANTVIRRLQTPPINLSPSLVETLDVICLMTHAKIKGEDRRKLGAIQEILSVEENGKAVVNVPFKWNPMNDTFLFKRQSNVFDKIVAKKGIPRNKLDYEFTVRARLFVELYKRKITGFSEVQNIIHRYYKDPQSVLKEFGIVK